MKAKKTLQKSSEARGDLPSLFVVLTGSALLMACGLMFAGCSKGPDPAPISTAETKKAQQEVKNYEQSGTDEQKHRVDLAFAELDQEIHELEIRVQKTEGDERAEAERKLEGLKAKRDDLKGDFTEAKFKALLNEIKDSVVSK